MAQIILGKATTIGFSSSWRPYSRQSICIITVSNNACTLVWKSVKHDESFSQHSAECICVHVPPRENIQQWVGSSFPNCRWRMEYSHIKNNWISSHFFVNYFAFLVTCIFIIHTGIGKRGKPLCHITQNWCTVSEIDVVCR